MTSNWTWDALDKYAFMETIDSFLKSGCCGACAFTAINKTVWDATLKSTADNVFKSKGGQKSGLQLKNYFKKFKNRVLNSIITSQSRTQVPAEGFPEFNTIPKKDELWFKITSLCVAKSSSQFNIFGRNEPCSFKDCVRIFRNRKVFLPLLYTMLDHCEESRALVSLEVVVSNLLQWTDQFQNLLVLRLTEGKKDTVQTLKTLNTHWLGIAQAIVTECDLPELNEYVADSTENMQKTTTLVKVANEYNTKRLLGKTLSLMPETLSPNDEDYLQKLSSLSCKVETISDIVSTCIASCRVQLPSKITNFKPNDVAVKSGCIISLKRLICYFLSNNLHEFVPITPLAAKNVFAKLPLYAKVCIVNQIRKAVQHSNADSSFPWLYLQKSRGFIVVSDEFAEARNTVDFSTFVRGINLYEDILRMRNKLSNSLLIFKTATSKCFDCVMAVREMQNSVSVSKSAFLWHSSKWQEFYEFLINVGVLHLNYNKCLQLRQTHKTHKSMYLSENLLQEMYENLFS